MADIIRPVILCGGAGTRLWPLSRKSFPKQFVPLIGGKSLLRLTLERVAILNREVLVVAAEDHRFLVADAMAEAGVQGAAVLEPAPRNTAAAMAVAALEEADPEALLLFCPADHHIPDAAAFAQTVRQGVSAARTGSIVTFGIVPSFPSTAYGYIEQGAERTDGGWQVVRFIEKPDAARARQLILGGRVVWNAGIFLCTAGTLLNALQVHAPQILQACRQACAAVEEEIGPTGHRFIRPAPAPFMACEAQSIDYAVMEKHVGMVMVPFRGQWSDVGSWNAVADLSAPDEDGNRIEGQGVARHSHNTYVHAPHRPVAVLGVDDLLVIDTMDAVLVLHRDRAEQVRDIVDRLEKDGSPQAVTHRKVARPWGWYDTVDAGNRFQVKRIGVRPGASLSLQKHHHRAEHWVVVKGTAEVTRGEEVFLLSENQSTYIPVGVVHRLRNPGQTELEIIEIQSGGYLGEDDIVRLQDAYGRAVG
ncbi:mannose-1-phosphate guanylyltransferase/mannose-6-phosphate isomerase [Ferrovibrio xuzhouensis]|uniref:mannose-1-phosphate guanylyltransferase n=1 Tax=Ferrovibrio xuzhouensis TaxID=1576914 RepID=A0ABV7VN66_9PROT